MKRVLSLLCALFLILTTAGAEEIGDDYTQGEKMLRQIELGSGLRGALKVAVSGDKELAQTLLPLNNTEFQMRMIMSGSEMDAQFYAVKQEQEIGQTEVYGNGENVYFRSSLLMGSTLTLPDKGDIVSTLTDKGGNPNFTVFLLKLFAALSENAEIKPAEGLEKNLRAWLESFAGEPEVISDGDGTRMRFSYSIPVRELKNGMKQIAAVLSGDKALSDWLGSLMSSRQSALVLDTDMLWYVSQVIDSLPLKGDMTVERLVSMEGEELESRVEMPVADPEDRFTRLQIAFADGGTTYTLSGNSTLVWQPLIMSDNEWTGYVSLQTGEETKACTYSITRKNETSLDAEDYHHDTTTYTVLINTEDNGTVSQPVDLQLGFHFYSRSAKRSATTLDVTLKGLIPGGRIQAAAKFRTTTPWELTAMQTDGSISLAERTVEERMEVIQDYFGNLLVSLDTLGALAAADQPAADETGTETEKTEETEQTEAAEQPAENSTEAIQDIPVPQETEAVPEQPQGIAVSGENAAEAVQENPADPETEAAPAAAAEQEEQNAAKPEEDKGASKAVITIVNGDE